MTGKNTPRFSDGRLYFQQIVADRITIKTQHEQVFVLPANMSVETDRVPSINTKTLVPLNTKQTSRNNITLGNEGSDTKPASEHHHQLPESIMKARCELRKGTSSLRRKQMPASHLHFITGAIIPWW
jgi:hypothetical protein